jgi:hypothetical protein
MTRMGPAETPEDLQAWLDDEPFRAFDRMADYRAWCESALPRWLGSKAAANRVKDRESLPRLRAFRDYGASRRRG